MPHPCSTRSPNSANNAAILLRNDLPIVSVPGDKSIAHRVLMLSCMRDCATRIFNISPGLDVSSTIRVLRQLGATIDQRGETEYLVQGWGERGPRQPDSPLDCGNSGTTARLIMGVIAPWDIEAVITGDESLRARPMDRVVEPLSLMGAQADSKTLPLTIRGTTDLRAGCFELPIASAQVKSALLFAGLKAKGVQKVCEVLPSRNHTEIMLASGLFEQAETVDYLVPGDPSSAAYVLAMPLLSNLGGVQIRGVCLNPTRLGFVSVLQRMGASVHVAHTNTIFGEPVGYLSVNADGGNCLLRSATVGANEIPLLIDEVPILSLIAAFSQGETVFCGVDELKVKESDRLKGIRDGLGALGVNVVFRQGANGTDMTIVGRPELLGRQGLQLPDGVVLDAYGDHRLALTWLVARECSAKRVCVKDAACIDVSYPTFLEEIKKIKEKRTK